MKKFMPPKLVRLLSYSEFKLKYHGNRGQQMRAEGNNVNFLFIVYLLKHVMVLTREQKERLVLDLYNQGKSTREIAEEARMSFRDIGVILDKAEEEKEASKEQAEKVSQSTQAYK